MGICACRLSTGRECEGANQGVGTAPYFDLSANYMRVYTYVKLCWAAYLTCAYFMVYTVYVTKKEKEK